MMRNIRIKSRPHSKSILLWLALSIFIIILSIPSFAKDEKPVESMSRKSSSSANIIKKVYSNGLTLLIKPNYDNEIVTVDLFLRMGELYESTSQVGISALMQRVLLNGGTITRTKAEINNELELLGASWNAAAFSDYGFLGLIVTKPGLNGTLNVFFDMIQNPIFSEVENGVQEIVQNLKIYEDQPYNTVSMVFDRKFFNNHPYRYPTEGSKETIISLNRDDIVTWYSKVYIPNNMVFIVVGNVNPDEIIKIFEDTFGKMKKGKLVQASSLPASVLEKDIMTYQPKNIQGAYMVVGYPAPSLLSDDVPAMNVLCTILGNGMSNRLFTELRDKRGLAYQVGASYSPMVGPSTIIAIIATAPEKYQQARDGIIEQFKGFIDEPVTMQELQAAKKNLKGSFMMSQETSAAQAGLLGRYELLGCGYQYIYQYSDLIDKVTPEDIQKVARKYFTYYVGAVVAKEGAVDKL